MSSLLKCIGIFTISSLFFIVSAETFNCSKHLPKHMKIQKPGVCNDTVYWGDFGDLRKTNFLLFEKKIVDNVNSTSNMGGAKFYFPKGTKYIFRSSFLAGPMGKACLNYLVKKRNVRNIVNLYNGSFKSAHVLRVAEKKYFYAVGGKKYTHIKDYEYKLKHQTKKQLFKKISEIINLIADTPGNTDIHCYGGIHRTGIIYGVLQKCVNSLPLKQVINEYRCHADYKSKKNQGGRNPGNEKVIREFPCEILGLVR